MSKPIKYNDGYTGIRPIVKTTKDFPVLIDTGADYNMWFSGKKAIRGIGGVWQKSLGVRKIRGVADTEVPVYIYTVDIQIDKFCWNNIHMCVPCKDIYRSEFFAILGMPMFGNMELVINKDKREITFDVLNEKVGCYDSLYQNPEGIGDISLLDKAFECSGD